MIDSLRKIYNLFPKKKRVKFYVLLGLMFVASLVELIGIGMIPVFVITIAQPDRILSLPYLGTFLTSAGIDTVKLLALTGAIALIAIYIFKNIFLTYFRYLKNKFVQNQLIYLQNRIFEAYMTAPSTFYISKNSTELLRNVNGEVGKIVNGTIMPFLEVTLHIIMFSFIVTTLFILEPFITLITILMMGGGGFLFLRITQKKTFDSGRVSREARNDMNRMVLQGLGGFKDARVLNREKLFLEQFHTFAESNKDATIYQSVVKSLPKPIIETLMVLGILTITLIMVYEGRSFDQIIPVLTLFGVAAVKLMPVFSVLIQQITTIRYSAPSVDAVCEDLDLLEIKYKKFRDQILKKAVKMPVNEGIELKSISYKYPKSDEYAVENINLTIPKGSAVAFVGASGAGKTTLVDIILGL